VAEALSEEIGIHNGWGPTRVVTESGKVTGVEFKRCLSTFDATGRFNPQFEEADRMIVPCDNVILSVGQTYSYGDLFADEAVLLTSRNTVAVDPVTLQSSKDDIFSGGDVASGPKLAIDAIAAGKEAAVSIHRFVQKGQSLVFGRDNHAYTMLDKDNLDERIDYDGTERQRISHVDGKVSKTTFKDLRGVLTEAQIQKETARCLSCGASKVDAYLCVGCGACTLKCKFEAIQLERVYDEMGYEIDDLQKAVLKKAIGRKAKIALNKVNPFSETR
jgi:ferredoxin